ncbi:RNA-guided endonuclease TnpB family protein [Thiocapsa sp.]|uniref:RNA-guided endonuclease InsQ/TnpB family protein n=1 Tax=Thiocapsa sp. TaxID=2024551 RepID=UPI001BD07EA8|nr:RNA-guided endonuclease TnpB family protein [Thiocapsa sp.]
MLRLQAFKFELMPDGGQARDMRRFAGSCRFVFNKALAMQQERYAAGEKRLGYAGLCSALIEWKAVPATAWLCDTPSQALQQTLKDLERAYTNFFRQAGRLSPFQTAVGIDMGIARFATLSDGAVFEPLSSFKRQEQALAKAQRAMSRKTKFGRNWMKAKAKVQRIHTKIANARRDDLHKTTTTISQNHAMVCIEDLQVRNMSASAAGTVEAPGTNVRAKSGLNKAILDQGWFEFRRQLDYKTAWSGGHLVAVPPQNTSRTCPCCGHIAKENRQTQARFACVECGFEENADLVGAINVLRAGHARLACGDTSLIGASAQEPAEATIRELSCV